MTPFDMGEAGYKEYKESKLQGKNTRAASGLDTYSRATFI
jgi:hypothetical protein